jgi:hypothetical protein
MVSLQILQQILHHLESQVVVLPVATHLEATKDQQTNPSMEIHLHFPGGRLLAVAIKAATIKEATTMDHLPQTPLQIRKRLLAGFLQKETVALGTNAGFRMKVVAKVVVAVALVGPKEEALATIPTLALVVGEIEEETALAIIIQVLAETIRSVAEGSIPTKEVHLVDFSY